MKAFLIAAALALAALPAQAAVSFIDFDTSPQGVFSGSVLEDGFVYSTESGSLYVNGFEASRRNMEGYAAGGGGVLKIVAADGGLFTLRSMGFAEYDEGLNSDNVFIPGTLLTVRGLRGGQVIATIADATFRKAALPSNTRDYTSFLVDALYGVAVDELHIVLNAATAPHVRFMAVDGITLETLRAPGAVPEPGAWALLILGFAAAGAGLRRNRRASVRGPASESA